MSGRFALDIETVSPSLEYYESPPDFSDSRHFELLAVCLGYESSDGNRETAMLFRGSTSPAAECTLVEETCEWLEARTGDVCLTYGGDGFDIPHLRGRAKAASTACSDRGDTVARLEQLLEETLDHVDVQPAAWDAFGEYTRLEEACLAVGIETEDTEWADFDHGIDLDDRRPPAIQGFRKVLNKDVPLLGERYLALADAGATDTVTFRALADLLEHYGREDVVHLFDLADARPFQESAPA